MQLSVRLKNKDSNALERIRILRGSTFANFCIKKGSCSVASESQ